MLEKELIQMWNIPFFLLCRLFISLFKPQQPQGAMWGSSWLSFIFFESWYIFRLLCRTKTKRSRSSQVTLITKVGFLVLVRDGCGLLFIFVHFSSPSCVLVCFAFPHFLFTFLFWLWFLLTLGPASYAAPADFHGLLNQLPQSHNV